MTSDLLLALLAMDAYSQGVGAAIPDVGTKMGGATVIPDQKLGLSPDVVTALGQSGFNAW